MLTVNDHKACIHRNLENTKFCNSCAWGKLVITINGCCQRREDVGITIIRNIIFDLRNSCFLFNLDENFEDVRNAIAGQSFAERIAYKDNEDKDIHVSTLLRLLFAFDVERYPDDSAAPVQSFSGKAQVFKRYSAAYDTPLYKSLTKQLPKLAALYDTIELELPQKYNTYKEAQGVKPRFGGVRGVESVEKATTTIMEKPTKYQIRIRHNRNNGNCSSNLSFISLLVIFLL